MKRCLPARASASHKSGSTSTISESDSTNSSTSLSSSQSNVPSSSKDSSSSSTSSKATKMPCFKTMDSFVMHSGKKIGKGAKKIIREKTATFVAASHLPY